MPSYSYTLSGSETLPKWEGRITVPTGGWAMSVTDSDGAATVTIPAGQYYWRSAGNGSRSFLDEIDFQLDAKGGGVNYTVALDDASGTATGKLTLTPSTGTMAVTWTSTDLRDVMGFTGNLSAASSHQSPEQIEYLWLPNAGPSQMSMPWPATTSQKFGMRRTDGTFAQAPSGSSVRLKYNTRFYQEMQFTTLLGSKVAIPLESVANESLEKFYATVIGEGIPVRQYKDRSDNTLYWTTVVENFHEYAPTVNDPSWMQSPNSLWSVAYRFAELIES